MSNEQPCCGSGVCGKCLIGCCEDVKCPHHPVKKKLEYRVDASYPIQQELMDEYNRLVGEKRNKTCH